MDVKLLLARAVTISSIPKPPNMIKGKECSYAMLQDAKLVLLPHAKDESVFVLEVGGRQGCNEGSGQSKALLPSSLGAMTIATTKEMLG